ncbi:MAG: hypothetical protein ACHQCI_00490, partial [Solirubrobacterales bacterium]
MPVRIQGRLLVAALVGIMMLAAPAPDGMLQAKRSKGPCDRVLEPGESLQPFVDHLRKGKTGCLSPGVHAGGVTLSRPGVTLR